MPKASKASVEPTQAAHEPHSAPEPTRRLPRSNGKHPGGRPPTRPSAYDEQAVEILFDQMIAGVQLITACEDKRCPHNTAIYQRMWRDKEFFDRIARVREAQQHAIIDTILPMADTATPANWQVVRLQIWARQWTAAKFAPKVFGEKSELHLIVNDALSDRLTAALKRQKEIAAGSALQIEGVAEPVVEIEAEVLPVPVETSKKR